MAPPVKKPKTFSSDNRRLISENQPQSLGSFMESVGNRWICNDVWMDMFPFFDHAQLGLKMALLSPRFDILVDKHFDGKSEWTIWREIRTRKDLLGPKAKLFVDWKPAEFPLPDPPLPNKIRFKNLRIDYIDHSVVAFLRSNQHIFDRGDTNLLFPLTDESTKNNRTIWDVFAGEIWPIFAANVRRLSLPNAVYLANLLRLISPTLLTDLNDQLDSIHFGTSFPAVFTDQRRGPNAATSFAGQALSEWLHAPRTDGQPKRFYCNQTLTSMDTDTGWINDFKQTFVRATTSARYTIQFEVPTSVPIGPFELVNERTQEKLTLSKTSEDLWAIQWIIKRSPIGETAMIQWEVPQNSATNLNNVNIYLCCVSCTRW